MISSEQIEYNEFYGLLETIGVDFVISSAPEKTPSYRRSKGTMKSM